MTDSKAKILERTIEYAYALLKSYEAAAKISAKGPVNMCLLGETPGMPILHKGVEWSNPLWLRLMISYGADLEAVNEDGETPLQLSLRLPKDCLVTANVIHCLLFYGARYYSTSKDGRTVFRQALLQNHNAFLLAYRDLNLPFNELDEFGNTLLHLAINDKVHPCQLYWLAVVGNLDPFAENLNGVSAMQMAIEMQNDEYVCQLIKSQKPCNYLKETRDVIQNAFASDTKTGLIKKYDLLIKNTQLEANQSPAVIPHPDK